MGAVSARSRSKGWKAAERGGSEEEEGCGEDESGSRATRTLRPGEDYGMLTVERLHLPPPVRR